MIPSVVRQQAKFLAISFYGFAAVGILHVGLWAGWAQSFSMAVIVSPAVAIWSVMAFRCLPKKEETQTLSYYSMTFGFSMVLSILNMGWALFWALCIAVGHNMNGYASSPYSSVILLIPVLLVLTALWSVVSFCAALKGIVEVRRHRLLQRA